MATRADCSFGSGASAVRGQRAMKILIATEITNFAGPRTSAAYGMLIMLLCIDAVGRAHQSPDALGAQLMETPYTAEERESQIEDVRDLRKRWGKTRRELHPRTLLRAMGAQETLSKEYVRAIVEHQYLDPVVSFYLDLDPEKVAPLGKGLLRTFHTLRTQAVKDMGDWIASLSRSQKQTLNHDLEEIEAFLAEYFPPPHIRSLVVFRSGEALNRVLKLEVHMRDKLVIDPDPYVVPLEAILERNEKVLFVEASKEESRFGIYQLGHCEQVHRIQSFVPSDGMDKTKFGTVQRHRLNHLEWHLKHTAAVACRLHNQHSFDVTVVMAENRIEAMPEEYLHQALKERIIGRIYNSPDADSRDRKKLIESVLSDYHAKKEAEALQELSNHPPEEIVSTLPGVIEACNLFVVRKLLVSERLQSKGFVCKEHHYASLNGGQCPFDNAKLLPIENVVDEIVEIARLHGVNVLIFEQRPELLASRGEIAAVCYRWAEQAIRQESERQQAQNA